MSAQVFVMQMISDLAGKLAVEKSHEFSRFFRVHPADMEWLANSSAVDRNVLSSCPTCPFELRVDKDAALSYRKLTNAFSPFDLTPVESMMVNLLAAVKDHVRVNQAGARICFGLSKESADWLKDSDMAQRIALVKLGQCQLVSRTNLRRLEVAAEDSATLNVLRILAK